MQIKPTDDQIAAALDRAIEQIREGDRQTRSTARANAALWHLGYGLLEPCGRGTARYQVIRAIFG